MDILRDQIWQFFGAVIGFLGIVVAIGIFLFQRSKKRLVYTILAETPLLSVNDEIKGKIKIRYGRKNIQNIHLVMIKIENQGNVDIKSLDYEQPINLSFTGSEILSAEIIDVSPKNLKPTMITELSKLIISPVLLNRKDYIVFKILFSDYQKKVDVDARIIGIKEVEEIHAGEQALSPLDFSIPISVLYVMLAPFGLSDFWAGFKSNNKTMIEFLLRPVTMALVGSIIFIVYANIYGVFRVKKKHK